MYVQRIVAEIEYHVPYVQQLSFYLTSKLEIRSEEDQAESDKSALMLRKCPVRPLFTVYDLIKKVLNVENISSLISWSHLLFVE